MFGRVPNHTPATLSKSPAKTAGLSWEGAVCPLTKQPGHSAVVKHLCHKPCWECPWAQSPAVSFGPFPQLESRFWGDQRLRGHRALVGHPALAGHPALWGHPALVGHPALKVALCTLSHVRYKQEKGLSMALIWVSEKKTTSHLRHLKHL